MTGNPTTWAVAPLTRKEAQVAREITDRAYAHRPPGATLPDPLESLVATFERALREYDQRPAWRRWIAPPAPEHTPRIRTLMEEYMARIEVALDDNTRAIEGGEA